MFVINSQYDSFQIAVTRGLLCLPPKCNDNAMSAFYKFRYVSDRSSFLLSCFNSTCGVFDVAKYFMYISLNLL